MTCPHCATRSAPGAPRCSSCGAPLLLPDDPTPRPLDRDVELDAPATEPWAPFEVASGCDPILFTEEEGEDEAWGRPGSAFDTLPAAAFESTLDAEDEDLLAPEPEPELAAAVVAPALPPSAPLRPAAPSPAAAARTLTPAPPVAAAAVAAVAAVAAPAPTRPAAAEDRDAGDDVPASAAPVAGAQAGAPIALRVRAFLVDAACVLAATVLPALIAARGLPASVDAVAAVGPPALGLVALAAFTYSVVAQATLGATPGQRLLGLRVTRLDGGALGFGEAALRAALAVAGTAAFGLGLLPALRGGRGRGLHDVVARTVVVLAP